MPSGFDISVGHDWGGGAAVAPASCCIISDSVRLFWAEWINAISDGSEVFETSPGRARIGTLWNVTRVSRVCKSLKTWCRGPESNWLRPPFQGGALPMSYPGTLSKINDLQKPHARANPDVSVFVSVSGSPTGVWVSRSLAAVSRSRSLVML